MKAGIIGDGISGLMVAYELQKMGIPYDLFEQNEQPGGVIKTLKIKNYILEAGPNSLRLNKNLENLVRELKLETELILQEPAAKNRYVFRNGKLQPFPASFWKLLTSRYFTLKTKLKIFQEYFVEPQPKNPHETISAFFERRFNREVLDYMISPLVMGLNTGDPEKLLMHKIFPKLAKYETEHGSVMAGLQLTKKETPKPVFTFKNGLQTLPNAIASKLISLHTGQPVEMITKNKGKFIISTGSAELANSEYDVLVLATPPAKTAALLEFSYPGVSAALQNISSPPVALVHSVYKRADVGLPLNGFGALNPHVENQFTGGSIWSSSVFAGRSPEDEILITSIIGGAARPDDACKPRTEILEQVHQELKQHYQISADKPVFQHYYFWNQAIPQYDMFIQDAHELTKALETDNIFVAANWYKGVSVPDCIKRAGRVAKKIRWLNLQETNG